MESIHWKTIYNYLILRSQKDTALHNLLVYINKALREMAFACIM